MTFWQARTAIHENDRFYTSISDDLGVIPSALQYPRTMRKAASMAALLSPRPATSPGSNSAVPSACMPGPSANGISNSIQDRSPFPPRISSLNWLPPTSPGSAVTIPRKRSVTSGTLRCATLKGSRPRTAGVDGGVEIPPGTVHASGISAGLASGTATGSRGNISQLPRQHRSQQLLDTSISYRDSGSSGGAPEYIQFAITRRSSSLFALETATGSSSSPILPAGDALMPSAPGLDVRNGQASSSTSKAYAQYNSDLSHSPSLPIYSSLHTISPTMRKASPMPQVAYPTPATPWQHASNGLISPTDSTPPAGKTSQVLAKLTSECDRLRREIKAEKAAKEEAVQQFQALKSRVNWLEEKKSMLSMQLDTNENALARKERRLDDLKGVLEEEIGRRKRSEEREAEMGRKLGETVSKAAEEVSQANTARKHAENAYTTLETEYSGLTRRIAFLRKEVDTLTSKINENSAIHKRQVLQLEVLVEQQRQAQEKSEKQVGEMAALLKSYWDTEANTKKLEVEMQDAVHEMRWVMRLHETREGQAREAASRANGDGGHAMPVQPAARHSKQLSQGDARHPPKSPKQRRKAVPGMNGVPI